MLSRVVRSIGAVTLAVGTIVAFTVPRATAASTDTDDNISPASTAVTANLKAGTKFTAVGTINGLAITVTCTTSTFKSTTPATGLGPVNLTGTPVISGCTDSLGGTDTVTTTGTWTLTFKDAANDETKEKSGDALVLTVPKAGATFKSNVLSSCTVIVAPTKPAPESSKYDDKGTATATNDTLPVKGQGCTATTSKVSETLTLSTAIKDVS